MRKSPIRHHRKLPNLDYGEEEKTKPSLTQKLKGLAKSDKPKQKITFNVGVAIILFFCYTAITFVCLLTMPALLLVLLPTLYVLIRYIKLERNRDIYSDKLFYDTRDTRETRKEKNKTSSE